MEGLYWKNKTHKTANLQFTDEYYKQRDENAKKESKGNARS